MASHLVIFLTLTQLLFILPSTLAQPAAPAPGPSGPINVTDILVKGGQYTSFLRLLNQTRVLDQLANQLNNSNQGMTLLAPTDNAFINLPSGTLNGLKEEDQVKLVLYHVLPKYYSLDDLDTVSNPVPTQAGSSHGSLGLNFTARQNQVNVSSGAVETQINNALRQTFPFAVYSIDKVLLLPTSDAPAPDSSSPAPAGKPAKGPSAPADAGSDSPAKNGGGKKMDMGVGLVGGVVLFCMAFV
ncbi:fasciclin-like arabinogalactan protein 9 [Rutidosis leptorrhynchoides]|uniref:fasciclin-like arabinogalactan protein 9 n=1 Tax=Rutidosis leptorrhynchoides TaxID=125765 RepID=UPI003A997D7D